MHFTECPQSSFNKLIKRHYYSWTVIGCVLQLDRSAPNDLLVSFLDQNDLDQLAMFIVSTTGSARRVNEVRDRGRKHCD